jgi:hypothetical protein
MPVMLPLAYERAYTRHASIESHAMTMKQPGQGSLAAVSKPNQSQGKQYPEAQP